MFSAIVSYIAIFAVAGFAVASAIVLALPTAVALVMKPENTPQDEYLLIRSNSSDYDEDR